MPMNLETANLDAISARSATITPKASPKGDLDAFNVLLQAQGTSAEDLTAAGQDVIADAKAQPGSINQATVQAVDNIIKSFGGNGGENTFNQRSSINAMSAAAKGRYVSDSAADNEKVIKEDISAGRLDDAANNMTAYKNAMGGKLSPEMSKIADFLTKERNFERDVGAQGAGAGAIIADAGELAAAADAMGGKVGGAFATMAKNAGASLGAGDGTYNKQGTQAAIEDAKHGEVDTDSVGTNIKVIGKQIRDGDIAGANNNLRALDIQMANRNHAAPAA